MSDYDFKNFLPPNTEVLSSESYLQGQETHLRISHFRLAAAECVVRHGTTFTVPEGNPPERRLTPNEELTAVLGTMGLTSPQAAGLLSKRPETVRGQRHDLYKKLAITTTKSMLAVPRRLVEHGILSISTPFVTPEDFWVESETLAWVERLSHGHSREQIVAGTDQTVEDVRQDVGHMGARLGVGRRFQPIMLASIAAGLIAVTMPSGNPAVPPSRWS